MITCFNYQSTLATSTQIILFQKCWKFQEIIFEIKNIGKENIDLKKHIYIKKINIWHCNVEFAMVLLHIKYLLKTT